MIKTIQRAVNKGINPEINKNNTYKIESGNMPIPITVIIAEYFVIERVLY